MCNIVVCSQDFASDTGPCQLLELWIVVDECVSILENGISNLPVLMGLGFKNK